MEMSVDSDRAELAAAKSELIAAAKAIDPLAPLREKPLLSVGVAAGIGVVLGLNAEKLFSPANLDRAISLIARAADLNFNKAVR
jgi:hypothetical protein